MPSGPGWGLAPTWRGAGGGEDWEGVSLLVGTVGKAQRERLAHLPKVH